MPVYTQGLPGLFSNFASVRSDYGDTKRGTTFLAFYSAYYAYVKLFLCFFFIVRGCQDLPCSSNTTAPKKNDLGTGEIFDGLLSVAAIVSYLPFIGCFMAAKRKNSALVCPSQSMLDVHRVTEMYLLFVAFLSFYMSGLTAFLYRMENSDIISAIELGTIFSAHWASVNTCNIFALSSFAFGEFLKFVFSLSGYRVS